jgi:hypothetical protein
MTAFGKLLVFMNLVFSVVTGALIVFVFSTRANWVTAHNHAAAQAKAAEAAFKTERASHENDLKQKEAALEGLRAEVTRLQNAVSAAQQETQSARDLATKNEGLNAADKTAQQKVQAELAQIAKERDALVQQQSELRARIVAIQGELDKQRGEAVLADLRSKNMEQKANNLLRQLEEMTARIRELEANSLAPGAGANPRAGGDVKPAPAGVRGKVTVVGSGSTPLAQIDIGSDSGLSSGNILIVYRGNDYLGDLKLTEVQPKIAVGQFTPSRTGNTIKSGDLVITSFSGAPR